MEASAVAPLVGDHPPALDAATLCEAFQLTAAGSPDQVALRTPGGDLEITFADYSARVEKLAAALSALGIGRGDTVAMMMTNRPEFHLVDTAGFHLGATPFSVYNTSSPGQIEHLLDNADARVLVCEQQFLETVRAADVPKLEHIVLVDGEAEGTTSLAELEAPGESDFDFEAAWRAVKPGDVATLIYTSGTTGPPKGVELTHENLMAESRACAQVLPMTLGGRQTSYLPSAHIADRWMCHYYASITFGATITSVADPRAVVAALPEVRPTVWGAVPRIWEKIKAALEAQGIADPSALPEETKTAVRAKLGLDDATWMISGAAPIPDEVLEYFTALGLPICELWGMSEISCCAIVNPPEDIRIGTVGKPLPGIEAKLLEDGELVVRGPIVMRGYRKQPDKTAEAVDSEGWMHTGDIAEIDADGYVKIVDRKKELIINAAGKNMSPANIEQRLKASSGLIGQAACIGDRRSYNVALLVLDPDACAQLASEQGLEDASAGALSEREDVQAEVARGVEEANGHLSRVEQIKRFKILPEDWEPGGDELTPTMKLKRKPIAAKYEAEIDALYA
ncbi:MAG: long-chain fatty acid--CoA ligase [Thermoleophilaceae bacterium]|nr:long-chain fatty acid--CoA ligase [Thermoleophilaceae bacterium]